MHLIFFNMLVLIYILYSINMGKFIRASKKKYLKTSGTNLS